MIITEITISRMGLEGQGVGYDSEENIYFVPRALIGDRVRVKVNDPGKRYRDAELLEVLEPGPDRINPACRYFQDCGGCDWLHWSYPAQLRAKEQILRHVLERGQVITEEWSPICGADEILEYRNRIQVRKQNDKLGFFKRGTHELVDIEECKVAALPLNLELKRIRETNNLGNGDEKPNETTKIELFLDEKGEVHSFQNVPHSYGGFEQIHSSQNKKLREKVSSIVEQRKSKVVLELFCGNGNLTFYYLKHIKKAWGIDASQPAIDWARNHREEIASDKVIFFQDKVDQSLLRRLPTESRDYDTLILDPPRQGTLNSLPGFLQNELKTIIYISCSPLTFSQDVQCLKKNFTLKKIEPIDMFPQTRHIELISTWVRH